MSKIFTRAFRVRFSELDATGCVSPASYLRYLVETAYDWGDALGLGAIDSQQMGIFWLIRETELQILRPLRHNDRFDFTIWMVNWQRVRGTRCFELVKSDGEIIARGSQHIVCMDARSLRPASPPQAIIENFRINDPRVFPFERFPKIETYPAPFIFQRRVEWGDLDTLEHINNATYVTIAEEAAARERTHRGWSPVKLAESSLAVATRRIHIQYLSPAVWGETLNISTHPLNLHETGGTRYVCMTRPDGSPVCECLLNWELVDRESGAVRNLPDEWL
jgi:YbgC/YbaW family acyl-CoA thioester hydrolase